MIAAHPTPVARSSAPAVVARLTDVTLRYRDHREAEFIAADCVTKQIVAEITAR